MKVIYNCLCLELGLGSEHGNPKYTRTIYPRRYLTIEDWFCLLSVLILQVTNRILPLWIPKLHKTPYKQRYIAGSSKFSTKSLSKLLTMLHSTVKTGLKNTVILFIHIHSGINQMWILKKFEDLLSYLNSLSNLSVRWFLNTLYCHPKFET